MCPKNSSNIVPFRSIKRYLPCRLFPVFSSNTIRFSRLYRSVPFHFVSFRFILFVRFHNRARACLPFSERGLRPLLEMASRGFVRRQEAARAYKRGCEAVGSPAKWLFSNEQEHRWTPRNSPWSV